ncbi:MAG: hypothetical protein VX764_00840 [Planctomycetota bacterium]|nr:hypothetical protein [Planctomycetota bacterium]
MLAMTFAFLASVCSGLNHLEEAKPVVLSCSIKALGEGEEKGKNFTVKDKKGNLKVEVVKSSTIEIHSITALKDIDSGTSIHVLARKQEEQFGSGGARYPPMLIQVQAIVAGSFKAPAVPSKLQAQGFAWVHGPMTSVENGREREVADHRLTTALGTEVLMIEMKKPTALKKRQKLFLSGYLDDSDRKNRKLEAAEIIVLQSKWKKYDVTHDLKNRRPPIKKEQDEQEEEDLPF